MKPNLENLDQWLFDSLEGNLSPEQQQALDDFLAEDPAFALEQNAWKQTIFTAQDITFEPKSALYRKNKFGYRASAAAALLLLFIGSLFYFGTPSDKNQEQAQQAKTKANTTRHPEVLAQRQYNTNTIASTTSLSLARSSTSSTANSNTNSTYLPNSELASSLPSSPSAATDSDLSVSTSKQEATLLPYLTPKPLSGYRTDLRFEELAGIQTDFTFHKNLRFSALQKINQFAQKELGLSNNQSYDLLLPAKSNIDANISSVGTLSQTRFQSMSFARTSTNSEQAFVGQQISLDGYARNLRAGLGLQANYKQTAAAITDFEIGLIAAPKIALNRQIILEPAARLRIGARYANAAQLKQLGFIEFENADLREVQLDTALSIGRRLFYKDLDFSLAIQTPVLFMSAQLNNAFRHYDYAMGNEQDPKENRAPQQLTVALGTQYASRNEKLRFAPYLLYTNNRLQRQFYAGAQFNFGKWQIGLNAGNKNQYQAAIGYFGKHSAILLQSTQHQLLTLSKPSYLHQVTFRIYSPKSRQARRYISL